MNASDSFIEEEGNSGTVPEVQDQNSPASGSLGEVSVPEEIELEYREHAPRGSIRPAVSDEQSLGQLSGLLDSQVGALKQELMSFLLDQRAILARSGEAAIEGERRHGMKRLALKQKELDACSQELALSRARGDRLEEQVENAANRCGRLKKAVDDRVHLMHLWGMWKAYVARNKHLRNLVRIGIEKFQNSGMARKCLREWHVMTLRSKIESLRREFESRLLQATEDYRKEAMAKEAEHQAQLDEVKEALAHERELRIKLEEDMRQAFMRGVCALNLEAINVFKQGVPHPLFNPNNPPVPPSAAARGDAGRHVLREGPAPGMEEVARRIQMALDNASTRSFYEALQARGADETEGERLQGSPVPRAVAPVPHARS